MKVRPGLLKRSIALGGLVALMGGAAVALTPAPAKAFIGVEVGPLAVGVGPTEPPPVIYAPPVTTVYEAPPPVTYDPYTTYTYTPGYYYNTPSYTVEYYGH